MKSSKFKHILAGTCLGTVALYSMAQAGPVKLTTEDASVQINGELLDFDGETYHVQTAIGVVSVSIEMVNCEGAACPSLVPESSEFFIAGSQALADSLIPQLIEDYGKTNEGKVVLASNGSESKSFNVVESAVGRADITLRSTNTKSGLDSLLNGESNFALATRPARKREMEAFADKGLGSLRTSTQEHIVALDGLLLVTHPENPVRAISEVNAALAFGGRLTNWSELGGNDNPINLYVREDDSGTGEVFDTLLMRPNALTIAANVEVMGSDAEIAAAVLKDPNGLGFTSFAKAGDARALDIEGVCGLRTPANAFTIKTEEYPLTRLLYMYQTNEKLPWHAQDFLNYINSETGQTQVGKAGFIDQKISSETINSQGIRVASAIVNNNSLASYGVMREMFGMLLSADRLSTTYRFETGSARLDARAEADVKRLAALLESDQFANKEVLFVGFTDSVGKANLNRLLSQQRAELVRRSVLGANPALRDRIKTTAVGYGEVSPLGCNETNAGRRINRRVEVWVQDIVAEDQLVSN